ncbi:MAG: hypothetical protein FH759_09765 [Sediminimonas qiaohouensis]|uniref:Uncharacterized protein n=1 Tax=Sediminimonas qiaohouensis TaxID=552061 RepID=A0A7C9LNU5_9RHOB|nr:hypothetical protein [Sediminimonas qiaohouensis]
MWQEVLEIALSDAQHRGADSWIGTRDFHMTCHLAGFDPEAVADRFRAGRTAKFKKRPAVE